MERDQIISDAYYASRGGEAQGPKDKAGGHQALEKREQQRRETPHHIQHLGRQGTEGGVSSGSVLSAQRATDAHDGRHLQQEDGSRTRRRKESLKCQTRIHQRV